MKKADISMMCTCSMALLFLLAAAGGSALDWELPVWSLKSELAQGAAQDEEEGSLAPTALRSTTTLQLREDAHPLALGLFLRLSAKDYLAMAGDYGYLELGQDARLALTDRLRVGYEVGVKSVQFPELDGSGLSKDYLALRSALDARLSIATGSALELALDGRWEPFEEPVKARQRYAASAALGVRLGQWDLEARWRGELRLPLGSASSEPASTLHTGSITLQWDPNRGR